MRISDFFIFCVFTAIVGGCSGGGGSPKLRESSESSQERKSDIVINFTDEKRPPELLNLFNNFGLNSLNRSTLYALERRTKVPVILLGSQSPGLMGAAAPSRSLSLLKSNNNICAIL